MRDGDRGFVTVPFHGPLCALTLPPSFVSQSHRVAALTSNLLWKIFRLPGEGVWPPLSQRCQSPGVVSAPGGAKGGAEIKGD